MWLWETWIQHPVRSGKIRVSKMSGLEIPSDAQTKYLGPEPLQRHTKACNWVLFVEKFHRPRNSDKEAYFADGVKL